jgi:hypothetical protein
MPPLYSTDADSQELKYDGVAGVGRKGTSRILGQTQTYPSEY